MFLKLGSFFKLLPGLRLLACDHENHLCLNSLAVGSQLMRVIIEVGKFAGGGDVS